MVFGWTIPAEAKDGDLLIVIGSPISVARTDESCYDFSPASTAENEIVICRDGVLRYRFSVTDVIEGEFSAPEIEFVGFFHYNGIPGESAISLLILESFGSELIRVDHANAHFEKDKWYVNACADLDKEECSEWLSVHEYVEASYNQSNKAQPSAAGTH